MPSGFITTNGRSLKVRICICVFYRVGLTWRSIGCGRARLRLQVLHRQPLIRRSTSTTRISSAAPITGCARIGSTGPAMVIRWSLLTNGKVFPPISTPSHRSSRPRDLTTSSILTSLKVFNAQIVLYQPSKWLRHCLHHKVIDEVRQMWMLNVTL